MRLLKSRKLRFAAAAIAFGALPLAGFAAATGEIGVNLTVTGPIPPLTTAALGDTVKFVADGNQPYVVAADSAGLTWVSPPLTTTGASYTWVVTKSGNVGYKQFGGAKPEYKGEIIVKKEGEVSLGTNKNTIPFGASATLSGQATPPGFPVMIQRRLAGQKAWFDVQSVNTNPDGTFTTAVQPTISTDYRATLFGRELISPAIKVALTPKLALTRVYPRKVPGGKTVSVTAKITPGSAATSIELARYNKEKATWEKVLTSPVVPVPGTARFTFKVPYGRSMLRAQVPKNRVRPGFLVTNSTWVLVQGTGTPPPEPEPERRKRKRNRNR